MIDNAVLDVSFDETGAVEPVTLAEAKNFCKIELDETAENSLLTLMITAARKQCESYLNISLVERVVTAILKNELGNIDLPYGPIGAITSIKDVDDVDISTDTYTITGIEFKKLKDPDYDYIKIVYAAGYATIPEVFKTAILNQICFLYENRGDVENLSPMVKMSLKPHRRVW